MTGRSENRARYVKPAEMIELRQQFGVTQEEAAIMLHVAKRTYQNWEYNVSRIPRAYYELFEIKGKALGLPR